MGDSVSGGGTKGTGAFDSSSLPPSYGQVCGVTSQGPSSFEADIKIRRQAARGPSVSTKHRGGSLSISLPMGRWGPLGVGMKMSGEEGRKGEDVDSRTGGRIGKIL